MYILSYFAVAKNTFFSSLFWVPYTISKQKNKMRRSAVRKKSTHFNIGDKSFIIEPSVVKAKAVALISSVKLLFWKSFPKFTRKHVYQSAIGCNNRISKVFLWLLQNFLEQVCCRTIVDGCSWTSTLFLILHLACVRFLRLSHSRLLI